jgi:hypothetical protein
VYTEVSAKTVLKPTARYEFRRLAEHEPQVEQWLRQGHVSRPTLLAFSRAPVRVGG